jgi:hypothetical protein
MIIPNDVKGEVTMTKKIKSTVDTLLESMSSKERQEFNEELKDFALSELILALIAGFFVSYLYAHSPAKICFSC